MLKATIFWYRGNFVSPFLNYLNIWNKFLYLLCHLTLSQGCFVDYSDVANINPLASSSDNPIPVKPLTYYIKTSHALSCSSRTCWECRRLKGLGLNGRKHWHHFTLINKNYYVVRNAGCARSWYTLKWSLIFLNQWMNEITN